MNKTVKALLLGYIYFDVNGEKFYTYNKALEKRKKIKGNVYFDGFNIFLGWRTFYLRMFNKKAKSYLGEGEK